MSDTSMIQKLCYDLYKVYWKRSHGITAEIEMDTIKDYYEGLVDDEESYTYDDYLEEFGYNGEVYVCFAEFMDAEYLDKEFICTLLDNNHLIAMYLDDIQEEGDEDEVEHIGSGR